MKPVSLALMLAATMVAPLHAHAAAVDAKASDRAQIQQLVDQFKRAIIDKDADAMRGMFLPGGSWLQGLDQTSLTAVRAKQPGATQFSPGNYLQFAKFIGTATKPVEETFDGVRIETDGTVGMVLFNYRFLMDGVATNHGVETWQVVHTDGGWKISAMLYSVVLDDKHR